MSDHHRYTFDSQTSRNAKHFVAYTKKNVFVVTKDFSYSEHVKAAARGLIQTDNWHQTAKRVHQKAEYIRA